MIAAPKPLEGSGDDQRFVAPGEAGEQRGDAEDDEAGDEQPSSAEEIGGAAAEQQEASEEQRVGADHPLEVLLRETEVDLDRGKRDVHDRDVQDDHELHRGEQGERQPLALGRFDHQIVLSVAIT